jgi:hypothetical protein
LLGGALNTACPEPRESLDNYNVKENQKASVQGILDAHINWHTACVHTVDSDTKVRFAPHTRAPPNLQLFPTIKNKKARGVQENKMFRGNISLNALVLDSGASLHLFANEDMLQNVTTDPNPTNIHCGGKS